MARATRPSGKRSVRSPKRATSDIALPGEKVVKETSRSVAVKHVKSGPDAKQPVPASALDRRRDVASGRRAGSSPSQAPGGGR